jgi:multiple sugar transport system substrate-binding protein
MPSEHGRRETFDGRHASAFEDLSPAQGPEFPCGQIHLSTLTKGGTNMKGRIYGGSLSVILIVGILVGLNWPLRVWCQDKVNLQLWIGEARPKYKQIIEEAAKSFTEKHPNIDIKVSQMLPKDVRIKFQAAATTDTLPDISWMNSQWMGRNQDMKGGGFVPMDDIIKELGGVKNFSGLELCWKYKGHYRGIPIWRIPTWLFYRKDLFAKAGLNAPKKWTDVLEAAKKLNGVDGIHGIGMAGGKIWDTRYAFECVLYGYGGQTMDKNCKPVYNSPETIAAMKMFTNLFKYAPAGAVSWKYLDPIRAFAMGHTAMCISYGTVLATVARSGVVKPKDVGIALPYEKVPNVTNYSSRGWTIFATTKHEKESKMFVKYLLKPEIVADMCAVVPLAIAPAYLDPRIYQIIKERDIPRMYSDEIVSTILSPKSPVRGFIAGQGECGPNKWTGIFDGERIFETGINNVLTQGWTAEKAVEWTQEQMERIIRENP